MVFFFFLCFPILREKKILLQEMVVGGGEVVLGPALTPRPDA